jgi:hypothetical protein
MAFAGFKNLGSIRVKLNKAFPLARNAGFGKDSLNRTFRNASFAIDAICWVDINHLVIHVETFHRANSYTISVFTVIAGLGYNMSHRKIPFPNYHGQIS